MNERVKQIAEQARQLTGEEQAELVDELLAMMHEPSPEWEKAWADEAERRWQAFKRGEMKSYSWEEVKEQLRKL